MVPTLHIHLLGDFRLISDDTPVTSIDVPRLQSLLAYLALHHNAPQSRTQLAYLLWPDSTDTQAHANLRTLDAGRTLTSSVLLLERTRLNGPMTCT